MSKEELTKEQYMRMHADDSIKRMAKKSILSLNAIH